MADKPKKYFRNQLEPNQTISLEQFAKEHGTTAVSARKWLLANNIPIHEIGNSRVVWSNDIMLFLNNITKMD